MIQRYVDENIRKKLSVWRRIWLTKECYLMLAPFMIVFLMVVVFPIIFAVAISFTSFDMISWPKFVGWKNYLNLIFKDDEYLVALNNTMKFALITGPISFVACFFVAWVINEFPSKIKILLAFLFYVPSLTGGLPALWMIIFSNNTYGLANSYLMSWGFIQEPIQWLNSPIYSFNIVMIVQIWMSLGTSFLAFIAGFKGIDKTLYEAGTVDGIKNRWQELFYITLPNMGPQLMFAAVMQIAAAFSGGALAAQLLGPDSAIVHAKTLILHASDYASTRYEYGFASALAVIITLILLVFHFVVEKFLKKHTSY